jgi:acyl-coenzyme A synthetase/AMP-(fatty) acid ligase
MFTSGSTGEPKIVGATLGNIDAYLEASQARYSFTGEDRVSHYNELGWDPYLLDLFGAWDVGACTYAVPRSERLAPAGFIHRHGLTTWYSVPSVLIFMERLRMLLPGLLPSLRLSLFVGEPLHRDAVAGWRVAAPNSKVENVYGPTECTVVCTGFELVGDVSGIRHGDTSPGRDYAPLGTPYRGTELAIIDEEHRFLPAGERGQIIISGAQVAPGYIDDPEQTDRAFILLTHPGLGQTRWYLTGDMGMCDDCGVYHFMGRMDNQVKVLGNRVELEAVEAALRELCGTPEVAAVPGAAVNNVTQWLGAAVVAVELEAEEVKTAMSRKLPTYMVPKKIIPLPNLPRNANGKIDRAALRQIVLES